jgi:aryl-alcohol dehydrogenase-like predicted oxidoreductase
MSGHMIRTVRFLGWELATSCLGFGCASLGSRVSARKGLAALARAHEAGVTWFDVAPAYGAGEAEGILGRFLIGRREGVSILTKVGLAPPSGTPLLRTVYTAVRPLLRLAPGLRRRARQIQSTRNRTLDITPDLIERSITRSLKRLGTDRVEVLALHEPDSRTVGDDVVIRALERVMARGQARHVGVAGGLEACLSGTRAGYPYSFFQITVRPGTNDLATIRSSAGRPVNVIGHSVLGVNGAKDAIAARLRGDASARQALVAAGYNDSDLDTNVVSLLLDAALAANPTGITLVSMFRASHLARNVLRASLPLNEGAIAILRNLASGVGSSN